MAVTEKQIQEGLQDEVQTLTAYFSPDTVLINDLSVLDSSLSRSPFFILINADDFELDQGVKSVTGFYYAIGDLFVEFKTWKESLDLFRDTRQAIFDHFNGENDARTAGGLEGTNITRIRPEGEISYILADATDNLSLPIVISQRFIFEVQLF